MMAYVYIRTYFDYVIFRKFVEFSEVDRCSSLFLTEVDLVINKIIHMKMVCKKHYHFHMKLDKSEKCTVMHLVRQMFLRLLPTKRS